MTGAEAQTEQKGVAMATKRCGMCSHESHPRMQTVAVIHMPHAHAAWLADEVGVLGERRPVPLQVDDALEPCGR